MKKKSFTLVEILISIVLYSVLFWVILLIYTRITSYKENIIDYNYTMYEKTFLQDYDQLICYNDWENKINGQTEKELCSIFDSDSDIINYVIVLSNLREKKYYKVVYTYNNENNKLLYNIDMFEGQSINGGLVIDKSQSEFLNRVAGTEMKKYNGIVNLLIEKQGNDFVKNFVFVDKNFIN